MPLRVTCPGCGCRGDIESFLVDEDAKRLAARFAQLDPALGRNILGYLRLFKPPRQELRLTRALSIVDDLLALVEAGTVTADERSGIYVDAPLWVWVAALDEMIARPPSGGPLKNHHYLRKVAFGKATDPNARPIQRTVPAAQSNVLGAAPIVSGAPQPATPDEHPYDVQARALAAQLQRGQITQALHDERLATLRAAYKVQP